MRLQLTAVGRMKTGPELALFQDYTQRFAKTGRALGFPALDLVEVEDRQNKGREAECALLLKALPDRAFTIALDERGQQMSSPDLAGLLARQRDLGRDLAFVIGGADGLDDAMRARADQLLSFGIMVWPHMLVRVMLAEQLYRAATILAGSPYHRL